jgi:hypothetical protein
MFRPFSIAWRRVAQTEGLGRDEAAVSCKNKSPFP